jgi:glycosyltransferase involved in cell wall biosynthesis
MKILSITAGAAGMYCGSCFRDNPVARELLAQGHDVSLVPVYTPTRTDEENVSQTRVLFGGISVYLQQRSALFRHLPRLLDRLWDWPAVIRALAGRSVSADPGLLGDLTVSMLEGGDGVLKREFDKLIEWIRHEPLPDVVNLPNSLLIAMARPIREALHRPVCCTLQGEELFLAGLAPAYRHRAVALIQRQVPEVDRFIAVSDHCARFMSDFLRIPPAKMAVVPLGIGMEGYARRAPNGDPFTVGYFARVAPEKGLHVLADAFVRFSRRADAPVRLEAAGYLAQVHRPYLDQVRQRLAAAGIGDRFRYRGEVDRAGKLSFLNSVDVLSVPATYDEPKGMFLLEAMASGVPVVQPRRGAFIEIVDRTGGGLLVEPNDPEALAGGLHALWQDRALGRELATRAFDGVRRHYTIAESARRLAGVYADAVAGAGSARAAGT